MKFFARMILATLALSTALATAFAAASSVHLSYMSAPNDINTVYYTDGSNVWYRVDYSYHGKQEVNVAASTMVISKPFIKLPGSDPSSFRILTAKDDLGVYVKDNQSAYYLYKKIPRAHAESFSAIGSGYAWDRQSVFFWNKRLRVQRNAFRVLGDLYATDGASVFYEGRLLRGADAATFALTGDFCAKDKRTIYCWGKAFKSADPASFESLDMGISKDATRVWCSGQTFHHFDALTFTVVNSFYAKDKKYAYYMTVTPSECFFTIIPESDPATFIAVEKGGSAYVNYAKDADHVYFNGEIVPNADPETFVPRE